MQRLALLSTFLLASGCTQTVDTSDGGDQGAPADEGGAAPDLSVSAADDLLLPPAGDLTLATCGAPGQPCCNGGTCTSMSTVCTGGVCAACGLAGQVCCGGACTQAGTICRMNLCAGCGTV